MARRLRPAAVATALVFVATGAVAAKDAAAPRDVAAEPDRSAARPLDLSDRTIRKAIADSRDPADDVRPARAAAFGAGSGRQARVDRAFREADVPSCLTPDALKFDAPTIGPLGLSGFLVLPYWAHAIMTGRCRH